jgi:hypothetical protein
LHRTRRLGILLPLALAVMAAQAAPAFAAKAAVLTGYDVLVPAGGQATLRFKVERDNLIRWDLHGVRVEFRAGRQLLGTAVSGSDGYADLRVNASQAVGDAVITGTIAAGQSYAGRDATLLVAIRDASARVVVSDVDWTLSAAPWYDVVLKKNADLHPVRGAVSGVNDVIKDATVVYVTGRDDRDSAKTKSWLAYWGFPRAPVFFSDDIRVLANAAPYKTAVIRTLHADFADMPCGFGDLKTDAEAYHANGLTAFIFDTHGAGPYPSYAVVYRDWDALRAANRAGQRPELSWATSFR